MAFDPINVPSYCCVEGNGESISEDLGEVWVLELRIKLFYDFLDRRRGEFAAECMWAL